MEEHQQEPVTADHVDDLDVPESESGDVKGGLPAVQKVREAAARLPSQGSKFEGQIEVESWSF